MSQSSDVAVSAVRITTTSGAVTVIAEPGRDAVTARGVQIELENETVTIDARSQRVELRVPQGMNMVIGTTSGRVTLSGPAGSVAVATTSGKVEIGDAESVDVRTRSGRVSIGRTTREARVVSASGRVVIDHSGAVDVTAGSGRIELHDVAGTARAHCTSGRIQITMAEPHDVDAETVSGRISISLPAGVRARLDTPMAASVAVSGEHDCVVTARSVSGRVDVTNR